MRYYCVINKEAYMKAINRFVVRQSETGNIFLLSFEDSDLEYIEKNSEVIKFIDGSTKIYNLENGKAVYSGHKLKLSPNRWFGKMAKTDTAIHKENDIVKKHIEKASATSIKKNMGSFPAYKSYWFTDRENATAFPFRFKKAKGSEKQPLVIFFSGADALGTDNIKPYFECLPMRLKLKKHNCNILIPLSNTKTNNGSSYQSWNDGLNRYVRSVKRLAEMLIAEYQIDESRIYIFGTSFGGFCTWRSAYLFPDFYAAALTVVGGFDTKVKNSEYTDFERMKRLPLWAAHSADDTNVTIDRDDYAVEKLRALSRNIKYTRWDKYGHAMAYRFYRKEKWCEWLFKQKRE